MCLYTDPLLGPRSGDVPTEMNITNVQITDCIPHSKKRSGILGEVIDFMARAGKIQNKPGGLCVARK